jgi:hypothetical protein
MDRKNYRKQITIGVIISFSLIFLSALYFFISLHHNLNNERSIVRVAENRFNIINEIKSSVDEVNDIKLDYLNKKDASLFIPYKMELKKMDELLRSLSLKDDFYHVQPNSTENIRKDIVAFYDFEQDIGHTKETQSISHNIHERKASILNQIDLMSRDLLDQRARLLEK